MEIKGVGISGGIAIGKAYKFQPLEITVEHVCCAEGCEDEQQRRCEEAKQTAREQLAALTEEMKNQPDKAKIFAAHQEFLEDEEIDEMIHDFVFEEHYCAEWAVESTYNRFIKIISKSKNKLIAERIADLQDVKLRLLCILMGKKKKDLKALPENSVIVAKDLLPSDTAEMDRQNVLAIITEDGGATSHSAIIAKSYRIPAVLGAVGAMDSIEDGAEVIVDADNGIVIAGADNVLLDEYRERKLVSDKDAEIAESWAGKPATTADGIHISAGINIGSHKSTDGFDNCDYVGLLRTEFIYMDSDHLPTEEEQYIIYKTILENMNGKTVTLRTLDIGGDKTLKYKTLPKEANPFLGRRALRLCFDEPEIFRTQLRAAYRASVYGKLQIMFPMVGSLDDWRRARDFALSVKDELDSEGIAYDKDLKLGVMIEIPAAAVIADLLAAEVDFASVGTNDLCQYLCAADRLEPSVKDYYQSYSPAFVRILGHIFRSFNEAGREVSVCGEMGGDYRASALLAGLGLRKFSMAPSSLGKVKYTLSRYTLSQCEDIARRACNAATQAEVNEILDNAAKDIYA